MNTYLCIDIGNSKSKIALFDEDQLTRVEVADHKLTDRLEQIFQLYPSIQGVILSSVRVEDSELTRYLKQRVSFYIEFSHRTAIPLKNLYKTPETLGKDRLAGMVAANNMFPAANVLVIDAGTAITYDLVNENKEYLGGNISPGLSMRFKALHQFTNKLPLIGMSGETPAYGRSTEEAIRSGVVRGMVFEVEGYINELRKEYKNLEIILTGGDSILFVRKLKNTIFVDQNLILKGLNRIILYNVIKK